MSCSIFVDNWVINEIKEGKKIKSVGVFYKVLRRWYLSKDLKKVREEIFGGTAVRIKEPIREKSLSRGCLVCLGASSRKRSYKGHRVIDGDKAMWPCGPLKGLWFLWLETIKWLNRGVTSSHLSSSRVILVANWERSEGEVRGEMGRPVGGFHENPLKRW